MSRKFFGKAIFLCILLIFCVIILSFQSGCDENGPGSGPEPNGTITGGYNNSPEDSIVRVLLDEFEDQFEVKTRITFFEGEIIGFLDVLDNVLITNGHLDYVGFYSTGLDILITQNWLKPYPRSINENDFRVEAIEGMKSNNTLYGVPIYIADGRVKGIGVSTHIENAMEDQTIELINYITNFENSLRITEAVVGGTHAYKEIRPDLVVQDIKTIVVDCPGGTGTCVTTVTFTIANIGVGNAGAFDIRIVADPSQSVVVNQSVSGGLDAGKTVRFIISTPPGGNCFDSDCTVCITVDSSNTVSESDETNNQLCKTNIG